MMLIWKKEPVPVFQRISSLLQHEYKTFAARLVCFCVLTTRSLSRACYILLFVVLTSYERHKRRKNEEKCQAFSFPHIKIGVSKISSIMGGKTELTTIKTLMEITGQNKEDVQSVLQKFGGDEALAVSELMCSACNHHLSYLIFHALAGKSSFAKRCVVALREQRLTLYDFSFLNYSA